MAFKAHWNTATNDNGKIVHTFYVAPLQIGGTITENYNYRNKSRTVVPFRAFLCKWNHDRDMTDLVEAKKWIEGAWLPIIQKEAPHYLPD